MRRRPKSSRPLGRAAILSCKGRQARESRRRSRTSSAVPPPTASELLFVAEKRAALDVVHDRLEKCGLGPLCLELHSHKANRKHVYEELGKTLALGRPTAPDAETYEQVRRVRDDLNQMSALLHKPDELSGDTPYGIIGMIADPERERVSGAGLHHSERRCVGSAGMRPSGSRRLLRWPP